MITKLSDNVTIVLLGSFNPGIFHPAWFEKIGLLPKTEIDDAKIDMATNDIALFTMSWVRIEVVGDRFVARTNDESKFGPLRDLVIGIFQVLEYSPVKQMGINRELRYQLPDEESWHSIGHTLAPKEPWLDYVKTPGLKSLTMETKRDDERRGVFNISVAALAAPPFSVAISFNDHFELDDNSAAADACEIIAQDWDKSLTRANAISYQLISKTSHQS